MFHDTNESKHFLGFHVHEIRPSFRRCGDSIFWRLFGASRSSSAPSGYIRLQFLLGLISFDVHSVPIYLGSLSRFRASRYFHFALARLRDNAFSLFMVDCNSFSKALRSDRV
jgi:hypothetical protein